MTISKVVLVTLIATIGLGIVINLALLPWYLRKRPELDKPKVSLEVFTITGIDMYRFNPMSLNLAITPNNASLDSFSLFHNYQIISNENCAYDLKKNSYNIQMKLTKDGLQHLEMVGIDSNGNIFYEDFQFWAGFNTLKVRVINEHNQPVIQTPVYLQLIEDYTAQIIEQTDMNGNVLFENIPSKNVRIECSSSDNMYAIKAVIGPTNQIELKLEGFNQQNISEWIFSNNTNVTIIPSQAEQSINYIDLNISNRRGEQTITRTFLTKPNTKSVKIRYRFIINGISNDSIYLLSNDYFRLTLQSKKSLTRLSVLYTLDMFMTMSEWIEASIPISIQEDIVQIDITVDTIINHLFSLNLQIGNIEEVSIGIRNFELKNTFLSIHVKNFNQLDITEIHGSLTIQGNTRLSLKNITLEIIQKGRKIATGQLATVANEKLLNKSFGLSGILNVSDTLLFELINNQATAVINMNRDGQIILRVRIISNENEEITADYLTPVKLLIHFTANKNHTAINDYILPSIQKFLTYRNDFRELKGCISPLHGMSY